MLRFLHPEFLWLLALLPPIALLKGKRGANAAVRFSSTGAAALVAGARRSRAGMVTGLVRMLALAALVVALARPQFGQGRTEVEASGIDIIVAIDVSSSMEALDFTDAAGQRVNRLTAVKEVVKKFIQERDSDRIGTVAFAARPYMVSPLTLDHDWLEKRLDDVSLGTVEDGTAIGSAIASSVNRLREQEAKSRIVVLLTDGMNNRGKVTPEVAAEAAKTLGIKVYTIGAGTRGEVPYPVTDAFGRQRITMQKVEIDEETLTRVAEMTGAQYFRATDTDSLQSIYDEINQLEKTERTIREFSEYEELFAYALVPGLVLLFSELALTSTLFRRLP